MMRRSMVLICALSTLTPWLAWAEQPKLAPLTQEYATKYNLPIRTVKVKLPGREVERCFVPITSEEQLKSFRDIMCRQGATCSWTANDREHPCFTFTPGKSVMAFNAKNDENSGASYGASWNLFAGVQKNGNGYGYNTPMAHKGQVVALALSQGQKDHYLAWLNKYADAATMLKDHPTDGPSYKGGCMWWLVHGRTGPEEPLAHAMGVTRAAAPSNFYKKLLHAGNACVGPVGLVVQTVDEFKAISDADLMGPAPGSGASEAVK